MNVHAITTLRRSVLAVAAVAALATIAAPTNAAGASVGEIPTRTIRYDDLNLATDAGARALHRRIVAAARMVCGNADARDLRAQARAAECHRNAVLKAVAEVGNERLARISGTPAARG